MPLPKVIRIVIRSIDLPCHESNSNSQHSVINLSLLHKPPATRFIMSKLPISFLQPPPAPGLLQPIHLVSFPRFSLISHTVQMLLRFFFETNPTFPITRSLPSETSHQYDRMEYEEDNDRDYLGSWFDLSR